MAVRSTSSRYLNYGYPSGDSGRRESSPKQNHLSASCSLPALNAQLREPGHGMNGGLVHQQQQQQELHSNGSRLSASNRLEYIINAMAYIRGELDDLKESDRVLLDIFKQLENNVSELSDSISTWRATGQTPGGRPASFTDLDFGTSRSSYCENSSRNFNGLETILDTSKEDIYKASTESDSLYLPELEGSSNSCSPVLPSLKSHSSIPSSINSSGTSASKRPAEPSPQLRTSTSFTSRLASSPSITRLQDETGSNISRNSSIDSGIQFASEAENGSANGVEPMQVTSTVAEPEVDVNDVRKSVGFADDIFAALGMK